MSRSEAFKAIASGELHRQMKHVWFDHRLTRKLRDEAPSAYKDIHAVMRAQRELTRIVLGRAAHVHPVLIIFCFLAGGIVLGIPGVILAVPIALLVKSTLATIYGDADA